MGDQTVEERRRIRENYREFWETLQDKREELISPGSSELTERLHEANELFKPVKTPREAVLDSRAINLIASLGRQQAQSLHTEFVRFQPSEFADKLVSFVSGGEAASQSNNARISAEEWNKLGETVQPLYRKSPFFQFMAGSFERGQRKVQDHKNARAPKEKDNVVGKETVPQKLKTFADTEKSEATTEEVERVFQILQQKYEEVDNKPLCYFEFVLNPFSFGQTVENIFYASFLIRDSLAEMYLDDDGLPVIVPLTEKDHDKPKEDVQRRQTVFCITPHDWQRLVQEFKIEDSTIPMRTREKSVVNGTIPDTSESR